MWLLLEGLPNVYPNTQSFWSSLQDNFLVLFCDK